MNSFGHGIKVFVQIGHWMVRRAVYFKVQTMIVVILVAAGISHGAEDRINLADFARVVKYTGNSPETMEARELERGSDGWTAWKADDGQYMIGIEWDEPRDITEAEIEFRHAISDRDKIQVQYFQGHWPQCGTGGWAKLDDPFHGKWVTAKAEWWAGDRDVGFAFAPYNEEQPGAKSPSITYRRTYRLRFLLGKRDTELPPVRYLRAYGPRKPADATCEIRLDAKANLKIPLDVSVVNGYLVDKEDHSTTQHDSFDGQPAQLLVRFAEDDLETPTRTIVTIRDSEDRLKGMSFLPAEVVKYGSLRIPSLGVTIVHVGGARAIEPAGRPESAIFDRVALEPEQTWERARREIPELDKNAQLPLPRYLPLGPPEARQEIAVCHDGNIMLDKSALKVPGPDSERLLWPADNWKVCFCVGPRTICGDTKPQPVPRNNLKQSLTDGYLPVVTNTWEHEQVRYEQTCVATWLHGEPAKIRGDETVVLLSRLVAHNPTEKDISIGFRLGIDPVENLVLDGGHVLATATVREGSVQPYDQKRYRLFIRAAYGDLKECPRTGQVTDALCWTATIKQGESASLEWFVPFVTIDDNSDKKAISRLDFDQVLKRETTRWKVIIEQAATVDVPDDLLRDFYKAQLAHILISADRDPYNGIHVLPAGTYQYGVCMNESCHQIRALEIRGLHSPAERYLDAFLKGQSTRGLHGRFSDKEGVIHGLPSKNGDYQAFNYDLDHGFVLWMLNEHFRYTRDRDWLSRQAKHLIAACDFVTRQCETAPESNLLGKDDAFWGTKMLPPGHLEDPPEWLWWFSVNAYCARGMRMTAESLKEIDSPEAARIAEDARQFDENLRRSCREAMLRAPVVRLLDGTYVPHQPTRSRLRGRDLGWIRDALYGPVHLIDCGIYPPDSPEAEWILRDSEDNVFVNEERGRKLTSFDQQWFSWGGITLQSNLLPNPLIYLRRHQPKHAIRAFYNSLAANVYADVRTFTEHPIEAYGLGRGPFYKAPDESAFVVWLRHLLIMEDGNDLVLLAGAPEGWLAPGKAIHIRGAATWFGPVDLETESRSEPRRLVVRLNGPTRNPPARILLFSRASERIKGVTLNGQGLSTFDSADGMITLPGTVGQAEVVIDY